MGGQGDGRTLKVLFVCGKARKRSPTAADLAARYPSVEADFAGLSADADERLSPEHVAWADIIAIMEKRQLQRLRRQCDRGLGGKRVVCLNIPDRYEYMAPDLIKRLEPALNRLLRMH